jgi:hypothetical protein
MGSKNRINFTSLTIVISLIFLTPVGYAHYTALVLLLPFLVITGNMVSFYDTEVDILMFFSFTYAFIFVLNNGIEFVGVGSFLKLLCVPTLFYQAGKAFVKYAKNSKKFTTNLFTLLFMFSLIFFLSIGKDINEIGYESTVRNLRIIGGSDEIFSATLLNVMISVWVVMIGFVFYPAQCTEEKKIKLIVLLISIVAIAFTIRLGSRTGLTLAGASCLSVIIFNFRRYGYHIKIGLIILITIVAINFGTLLANSEDESIFIAYKDRMDNEEFGISTVGSRTEAWKRSFSMLSERPMGEIQKNPTTVHHGHNYFLDIARVSGVIPMMFIIWFTILALRHLKKLLLSEKIPLFIRNSILVLNVAFYMVFMVEPIIEGAFSLFLLYLFTCGISRRLIYKG